MKPLSIIAEDLHRLSFALDHASHAEIGWLNAEQVANVVQTLQAIAAALGKKNEERRQKGDTLRRFADWIARPGKPKGALSPLETSQLAYRLLEMSIDIKAMSFSVQGEAA